MNLFLRNKISKNHIFKMATTLCYSSSSFDRPTYSLSKQKGDDSIIEELKDLPLNTELRQRAQCVYQKLKPKTHRGNRRKQMLFYCIYVAALELRDESDDPENVEDPIPAKYGKMLGLSHGAIRKSMSMFSETQTGYRPKTGNSNPLGMIKDYCVDNRITVEMVEPIKALGREILEKDPELKEEYPQTVAAGLIRYYITISGGELDSESFAKNVNLSQATINAMYNRIAKIDNSE